MLALIIKYGLISLGVFLLLSGVITGGNDDRKLGVYFDYGKVFDTLRDNTEEIKPHKIIG